MDSEPAARLGRCLAAIARACPEIDPAGARLVRGHGQNHDVVILGERLVFRFPLYPDGVARLRHRATLLRALRPHLPLPIPDPIRLVDDAPVGQAFLAYPLIPGEPFQQEHLEGIGDASTLVGLGRQVGGFLRALHAVPPSAIGLERAEPPDLLAPWRHLHERIEAALFPRMRPSVRAATARHFERFLNDPRNRHLSAVVVHGDFGTGNLLYEPATDWITGVIDFDEAGLGDAAVDFAALPWTPSSFFEGLVAAYPAVATADERVAFYRGTFALQEALFGVERGDEEAFRRGIAAYI